MYFCPDLKCTFFVVSIFHVACIFGLFTLVSSSTDSSTLLFTISTCDFPEKGLCRLSHFWGWFREEEEPRKLVLWGTLKLATAAAGAKQPRLVDQEKRRYFVLKPLHTVHSSSSGVWRGSNAWICSTTQQLMTTELLLPGYQPRCQLSILINIPLIFQWLTIVVPWDLLPDFMYSFSTYIAQANLVCRTWFITFLIATGNELYTVLCTDCLFWIVKAISFPRDPAKRSHIERVHGKQPKLSSS